MNNRTTRRAIEYYRKARKGSEKDYDRLIDYTGSLKKAQIIPIIRWLIQTASRECLLDMLASALNYDDSRYETLRQKINKRFGVVYRYPDFDHSTKLPSK